MIALFQGPSYLRQLWWLEQILTLVYYLRHKHTGTSYSYELLFPPFMQPVLVSPSLMYVEKRDSQKAS